jgi:uroporphyrin-III C-methyltransferase
MGVSRCAEIVAALMAGGMRADMPAAVVSAAHTPRQREARGTLAGLPALLQEQGLPSPAILVIGEVAAMQAIGAACADEESRRVG